MPYIYIVMYVYVYIYVCMYMCEDYVCIYAYTSKNLASTI